VLDWWAEKRSSWRMGSVDRSFLYWQGKLIPNQSNLVIASDIKPRSMAFVRVAAWANALTTTI
jgi:hypothetical protein